MPYLINDYNSFCPLKVKIKIKTLKKRQLTLLFSCTFLLCTSIPSFIENGAMVYPSKCDVKDRRTELLSNFYKLTRISISIDNIRINHYLVVTIAVCRMLLTEMAWWYSEGYGHYLVLNADSAIPLRQQLESLIYAVNVPTRI